MCVNHFLITLMRPYNVSSLKLPSGGHDEPRDEELEKGERGRDLFPRSPEEQHHQGHSVSGRRGGPRDEIHTGRYLFNSVTIFGEILPLGKM